MPQNNNFNCSTAYNLKTSSLCVAQFHQNFKNTRSKFYNYISITIEQLNFINTNFINFLKILVIQLFFILNNLIDTSKLQKSRNLKEYISNKYIMTTIIKLYITSKQVNKFTTHCKGYQRLFDRKFSFALTNRQSLMSVMLQIILFIILDNQLFLFKQFGIKLLSCKNEIHLDQKISTICIINYY
eukprot:TRINITY_DN28326_c0_g1_i3.p1 TRINITY_DN28326_c0_g1~~TRINITY_DN28326_c0_g1_i3.p1  ORF type:complete len:185 (-),score=-27.28 TRINITY_DN28326_c0_g1_i3:185-739(-)